jgi:Mn2+/Fe2+ NRAMP family transporter
VFVIVGLLGVGNTCNLGADLGMMAEVMRLLVGVPWSVPPFRHTCSSGKRPRRRKSRLRVIAGWFIRPATRSTCPVRELFWAAILNGIISAPIMAAMVLIVQRETIMGPNVIGPRVRVAGWLAVALMAAVSFVLLGTAITDRP